MTATVPSTGTAPRYIFSGHAIGASAQFDRLDETHNLNHVVPTQGATALPPTGGLSKSHVGNFSFDVDQPRPRTLLRVGPVHLRECRDRGRDRDSGLESGGQAAH